MDKASQAERLLWRIIAACAVGWLALQVPASQAGVDVSLRLDVPSRTPVGQRVAYILILSNAGPSSATGVIVTNQIPQELTDVEVAACQSSFCQAVYPTNSLVRWEFGTIGVRSVARVEVYGTPTNSGLVTIEAGVTSLQPDTEPQNNLASALMQFSSASLQILAQADTNSVQAGVPFDFTAIVTNLGPDDANNVEMFNSGNSDYVPMGYTLSQGQVVEFREGGLPWHVYLGSIPASGSETITMQLVPRRTGDLSFISSATLGGVNLNYTNVLIPVKDGPGIVRFASGAKSVRENAQTTTVEIKRFFGAEGTISVQLVSEDGSAHSGQDYRLPNTLVVFTEGETEKTASITILDNNQRNCNGTFTLSLREPTGGAFLDLETNLSLSIWDDDLVPVGELTSGSISTNALDLGNGDSAFPSISPDGRWVAFASAASNLAPNDTNGFLDLFLKDLQSGELRLLSKSRSGAHSANGNSYLPRFSGDARHIAFDTWATDLVTNDVPAGNRQIVMQDLVTGMSRLVTITPQGSGVDTGDALAGRNIKMGLSSNGQFIAFLNAGATLANGKAQLFVRDTLSETTTLVTKRFDGTTACNGDTYEASLSADGHKLAFVSSATDLVPGASSIGDRVYVSDLTTASNTLIAVGGSVTISANGRFVAFVSAASALAGSDDNPDADVFVHDLQTGVTRRASAGLYGPCDTPSISDSGQRIAFRCGFHPGYAPDEPWPPGSDGSQVYVHDILSNITSLVSINCSGAGKGNLHARNPVINSTGQFVFFQSFATDLVPGVFANTIANLFCRDLERGVTFLVSQNRDGTGGATDPYGYIDGIGFSFAELSADGRTAVFASNAEDLAWEDGNGFQDVFVWRVDRPFRPGPSLAISREGEQVVLRWPVDATNFVIEATETLLPATWTQIRTMENSNVFRVMTDNRGFFRLKKSE